MITTTLLLALAAVATNDSAVLDWSCELSSPHPDQADLPLRRADAVLVRASAGSPGPGAVQVAGSAPPNRVDLVFVGDGFLASEIDEYAQRVGVLESALFLSAPYDAYANYFNVHRVDVVSAQSGVDGDPTPGVQRETALGMGFWCDGVERRLCVDTNLAWAFAQSAPAADVVIAVANSTKHGGAGYPFAALATVSSSNIQSGELVKHEFGHGFARLADEYWTSGTTYTGGELGEPNVSIYAAEEMLQSGSKWANWIGFESSMLDGPVQALSGGRYFQFGIRRPSPNSLMRNLGRPLNAPSAEAVVLEIYRHVLPIESSSDPNLIYSEHDTLFVNPMQPLDHDLSVSWSLDGTPLPGVAGNELPLCSLALSAGWHAVSVSVVDETDFVRDQLARSQFMTQSLLFPIFSNGTAAAEVFCSSAPNSTGSGAHMGFAGSTSIAASDLALTARGAVPGQSAIFLSGTTAIELPFGDGFRCAGGDVVRLALRTVDAGGDVSQALNLSNFPGGAVLQAGDERTFQLWYRDPAMPLGSGFNLSDGLRLRFCP